MKHRDWVIRRGAVDAMFECSGFRLVAYKKDLVEQLNDRSPDVVIHVVDALILLTHRAPEIWDILEPLLEDHRACKATMRDGSMIKISEYVAPYFE